MWKFLGAYLRPYRGLILAGLILNAISGIAMSAQTMMPKYLLDDVLLAPGLTQAERTARLLEFCAGYLAVVVVFRMLFWHFSYRVFTHVREKMIFALRSKFFRQINALCLRFHLQHSSGELYSYLFGSPLTQVQQYFQQLTMSGAGAFFILITTLLWVFAWDWVVALVFVFTIVLNLLLMKLTQRRIKVLQFDYQNTEGHVGGYVADLIRGNRAIKLHGVEKKIVADFDFQAEIIGRKSYQRDILSHIQNMKQETVNYFLYALLGLVCGWRYWTGHLSAAEVLVSLGALNTLTGPLQQLFTISTLQAGAEVSLERLQHLLMEQSTTPDPPEPQLPPRRGEIFLDRIHFTYESQPVFQDFSLRIPYGQRLALVGPSGSGKSTLTQLLLRFYDPTQGTVSLEGRDLKNFFSRDLRRLFGVVPQDPYLFSTTLRDNLRLIKPEATEAEMQEACRLANAWEFIEKLPQGLATVVGEGGATLSGGQRQRLAIARALLIDPPFYIFDEATSALDNLSEKLIQQSLEKILVGKTAVFIAHRLSTVAFCDRLVVLQQGKIVQEGTYAELSRQAGLFQDMLQSSALAG